MNITQLKGLHPSLTASLSQSLEAVLSSLEEASTSRWEDWSTYNKSEVVTKVMKALGQKSYLAEKLQADSLSVEDNPLYQHILGLESTTKERHEKWKESCQGAHKHLTSLREQLNGHIDCRLFSDIKTLLATPLMSALVLNVDVMATDAAKGIETLLTIEEKYADQEDSIYFASDDDIPDIAEEHARKAGFVREGIPSFISIDWAASANKFKEGLDSFKVENSNYFVINESATKVSV